MTYRRYINNLSVCLSVHVTAALKLTDILSSSLGLRVVPWKEEAATSVNQEAATSESTACDLLSFYFKITDSQRFQNVHCNN